MKFFSWNIIPRHCKSVSKVLPIFTKLCKKAFSSSSHSVFILRVVLSSIGNSTLYKGSFVVINSCFAVAEILWGLVKNWAVLRGAQKQVV